MSEVKQLGSVGRNSAQEFFETILYMTAYNEAQGRIDQLTKNIENETLKAAAQSAGTVLAFGVVFTLIRIEEKWLNKIIDKTVAITVPLIVAGNNYIRKAVGKVGTTATRKYPNTRLAKFFRGMTAGAVQNSTTQTAQAVTQTSQMLLQGRHEQHTATQTLQTASAIESNVMRGEKLQLDTAKAHTDSYQQNLMFKLFSKNFTSRDMTLLRQITGKKDLQLEDVNTVADFMFVTDDQGNPTGLTQSMIDLINSLGYMHK